MAKLAREFRRVVKRLKLPASISEEQLRAVVESVNGRPIKEIEYTHDGRDGLPPAWLVRDERFPFDVLGIAATSSMHRRYNRFHEYAHVLLNHAKHPLPETVRAHLPNGFSGQSQLVGHGKARSADRPHAQFEEELCELVAAYLVDAVSRSNERLHPGFSTVLR